MKTPGEMADGFEVVVKPRVRPAYDKTAERRLVIVEEVYDELGGGARFERCVEETPSGTKRQRLLRRVRQEGRRATQWEHDLHMMSQLRHFNILQYEDSWVSRDGILHVLCFDARMFLSVCLRQMAPERPSGVLYELWLIHIVSALEYMHDHNEDQPMLHRNVQPDNILITNKGVLKLCAFGVAKRLEKPQGKTETRVGGGLFQSPEIQRGRAYDQSTDIWSFGVTAVYMAHYQGAQKAASKERLLAILQESGQSSVTMKVVSQALRSEPAERPKASSIVKYLQQHGSHSDSLLPPADLLPSPLLNASTGKTAPSTKVLPTPNTQDHTVKTQERQVLNNQPSLSLPPTTDPANDNSPPVSRDRDNPTRASGGSREKCVQTSTLPLNDPPSTSCVPAAEAGSVQTLVKTAEVTTQTSFYTIPPKPATVKETRQAKSTQTSVRQQRKTKVIIIRRSESANRERYDRNRSRHPCQVTELITEIPSDILHRRRRTPNADSSTSRTSSGISTASSTVTPPSPATTATASSSRSGATTVLSWPPGSSAASSDLADSQRELRKELEKLEHFERSPTPSPKSASTPLSTPKPSRAPHSGPRHPRSLRQHREDSISSRHHRHPHGDEDTPLPSDPARPPSRSRKRVDHPGGSTEHTEPARETEPSDGRDRRLESLETTMNPSALKKIDQAINNHRRRSRCRAADDTDNTSGIGDSCD